MAGVLGLQPWEVDRFKLMHIGKKKQFHSSIPETDKWNFPYSNSDKSI